METTLGTTATVTLTVCDQHYTSTCLEVDATSQPAALDAENGSSTLLDLSILLRFGPDRLVLRKPPTASPLTRFFGRAKAAWPLELEVKFGVNLVDLNLKLVGMRSIRNESAAPHRIDLDADIEIQTRSEVRDELRQTDDQTLEAKVALSPALKSSAKTAVQATEGHSIDKTSTEKLKQTVIYPYAHRENPHWEVRNNSDRPLEREVECKTVLELSHAATDSEIEATTGLENIRILHATVTSPTLSTLDKTNAWIAAAVFHKISKGLLYRATLSPVAI